MATKNPSRLGERKAIAASFEEGNTQFLLQVANLPAQWWLRNVKPPGSLTDVRVLGHSNKVAQMP